MAPPRAVIDAVQDRLGPLAAPPVALGGGITNHNFRATFGDHDVVIRIAGAETELLGIDRAAEHVATEAAAKLGIAPAVLAFLPEHTCLPDEVRQDPTFHRTGGTVTGRDGCRVPMPWVREAPSLGFGPGGSPWLPQPDDYAELAVDQQEGVEGSTLELYRALLASRRRHRVGHGSLTWDALSSDSVVALRNTPGDGERTLLVVVNLGEEPVPLPEGDVLVSSGPLTDTGAVPCDTTAWVRLPGA